MDLDAKYSPSLSSAAILFVCFHSRQAQREERLIRGNRIGLGEECRRLVMPAGGQIALRQKLPGFLGLAEERLGSLLPQRHGWVKQQFVYSGKRRGGFRVFAGKEIEAAQLEANQRRT